MYQRSIEGILSETAMHEADANRVFGLSARSRTGTSRWHRQNAARTADFCFRPLSDARCYKSGPQKPSFVQVDFPEPANADA